MTLLGRKWNWSSGFASERYGIDVPFVKPYTSLAMSTPPLAARATRPLRADARRNRERVLEGRARRLRRAGPRGADGRRGAPRGASASAPSTGTSRPRRRCSRRSPMDALRRIAARRARRSSSRIRGRRSRRRCGRRAETCRPTARFAERSRAPRPDDAERACPSASSTTSIGELMRRAQAAGRAAGGRRCSTTSRC